eukprot:4869328-Pleurochrysis_carterae.AAC.1
MIAELMHDSLLCTKTEDSGLAVKGNLERSASIFELSEIVANVDGLFGGIYGRFSQAQLVKYMPETEYTWRRHEARPCYGRFHH